MKCLFLLCSLLMLADRADAGQVLTQKVARLQDSTPAQGPAFVTPKSILPKTPLKTARLNSKMEAKIYLTAIR